MLSKKKMIENIRSAVEKVAFYTVPRGERIQDLKEERALPLFIVYLIRFDFSINSPLIEGNKDDEENSEDKDFIVFGGFDNNVNPKSIIIHFFTHELQEESYQLFTVDVQNINSVPENPILKLNEQEFERFIENLIFNKSLKFYHEKLNKNLYVGTNRKREVDIDPKNAPGFSIRREFK
jgi:hypothetical protein